MWCTQVIKDEQKKGFSVVQVPTALLVGGPEIDKDKGSTYIVYMVSWDQGYWTYKAGRQRHVNLLINTC